MARPHRQPDRVSGRTWQLAPLPHRQCEEAPRPVSGSCRTTMKMPGSKRRSPGAETWRRGDRGRFRAIAEDAAHGRSMTTIRSPIALAQRYPADDRVVRADAGQCRLQCRVRAGRGTRPRSRRAGAEPQPPHCHDRPRPQPLRSPIALGGNASECLDRRNDRPLPAASARSRPARAHHPCRPPRSMGRRLKGQPARVRTAITANKVVGKAGNRAVLPGDKDDDWSMLLVCDEAETSPYRIASLGEQLPEGTYRLATGEPGAAMPRLVVSQYRFDRYRKDENPAGPRTLLTGEPGKIEETLRIGPPRPSRSATWSTPPPPIWAPPNWRPRPSRSPRRIRRRSPSRAATPWNRAIR
ncbi:hypothetical protein DdX_22236 [Ditylenchus destructor]|uniref:Uncharacterized protein n=1 Tax=Ditylenchus destructor TaxID=166010 RepID=A0AAD4QUL3_9BILA|nr:hypothetical protein DdX_22236 [Ditylenchus destructor]